MGYTPRRCSRRQCYFLFSFSVLYHQDEEASCRPEGLAAISQVKSVSISLWSLGRLSVDLTAVIGALTLHHTSTIICSGRARAISWLTVSAKRIDCCLSNKGYCSLALFSFSLLVLISYGTVQFTTLGQRRCSKPVRDQRGNIGSSKSI